MSPIHIARRSHSLGSFSEEELEQGIASQRFLKSDLFWKAGMKEWQPLSKWEMTSRTMPELIEPAWERRSELGFLKALF